MREWLRLGQTHEDLLALGVAKKAVEHLFLSGELILWGVPAGKHGAAYEPIPEPERIDATLDFDASMVWRKASGFPDPRYHDIRVRRADIETLAAVRKGTPGRKPGSGAYDDAALLDEIEKIRPKYPSKRAAIMAVIPADDRQNAAIRRLSKKLNARGVS